MNKEVLRSAFIPSPSEAVRGGQSRTASLFLVLLQLACLFGFVFSLTCLWFGMRGVMDLGGFVASGGPYAIAHQAPRFAWIIPVSVWVGLIFLFLNSVVSRRIGGLRLLGFAWPALFLSLGWNFLEYAVHPPGDGGLAWGWLACGVVFVLMGGVPLLFIAPVALKALKRRRAGRNGTGVGADRSGGLPRGGVVRVIRFLFLLVQLAALAGGIYAAQKYFQYLNAPRASEAAEKGLPRSGGGNAEGEPLRAARESSPRRPAPVQKREARNVPSPGRVLVDVGDYHFEIDPAGRTILMNGTSYEGPSSLPPEAERSLRRASEALLRFLIGPDEPPGAEGPF